MTMPTVLLDLDTSGSPYTDVTDAVAAFCADLGDGLVNVFAPHATAGLALIETGSGTEADLDEVLGRLLPRDERWSHRHGTPGHGVDHVLPAFISPSVMVPVVNGELQLGTWQSVVFVDQNVDNPSRQLRLSFISA